MTEDEEQSFLKVIFISKDKEDGYRAFKQKALDFIL
ncbi:MAG: hypothetical protein ACI9L6_001148 [Flavobacterium sp.]|jgi:hypothetical protein